MHELMNESQHSTMMGNPSRWCSEVHMAGSWQVAGHSVVNKASQDTSTQSYWDESLHQGPRWAQRVGVMSLCDGPHGPGAGQVWVCGWGISGPSSWERLPVEAGLTQ